MPVVAPESLLNDVRASRRYRGQIVDARRLPERPAATAPLQRPLPAPLAAALAGRGIGDLYTHQAAAIDALRDGRDVAVVTGTASGKTLCYFLPALENLLADERSRTLCLYPTKALAQDQHRGLRTLAGQAGMPDLAAGVYDGDTPAEIRNSLRTRGRILLSNPDMLHQAMLPNHSRWQKFFARLRLVVLDELHVYRGTFGSHVGCVLRRLQRICAHYRARPQFVCCSATIGNAGELAEKLLGRPVHVVDADGSPRGSKHFVLWNPPLIVDPGANATARMAAGVAGAAMPPSLHDGGPTVSPLRNNGGPTVSRPLCNGGQGGVSDRAPGHGPGPATAPYRHDDPLGPAPDGATAAAIDRKSAFGEAVDILLTLIERGVQTICFARTRSGVEIIARAVRDSLEKRGRPAARLVAAYRGGFLPEERRRIERKLAEGELLCVVSTNALEMGIDIGGLDAAVLVGWPGSVAGLWQQAGRAGRGRTPSLVFFIAGNAPVDQFLCGRPDWLFGRNPEAAVVDPGNPHVVMQHLDAALHELPVGPGELDLFGGFTGGCLKLLTEAGKAVVGPEGWRPARAGYPAAGISLRASTADVWNIIRRSTGEVVGTVDDDTALFVVHPHAVYLHQGDTYHVEELDLVRRMALVEPTRVQYYTQAVSRSEIRIRGVDGRVPWRGGEALTGDLHVTTTIPFFKKIRFGSRESIGFEQLALPERNLDTVGFWILPPADAFAACESHGLVGAEGLTGVANAMTGVLPLFAMCDTSDVGSAVDAGETGTPALFVYDRAEGGMGYAAKAYERLEDVLRAAWEVISRCPCEEGCPACVGAPMPAAMLNDLESSTRTTVPHKETALVMVHALLGLAPYVPVRPRGERAAAMVRSAVESGGRFPIREGMPVPEDAPRWDPEAALRSTAPLPVKVADRLRRRIGSAG